MKTKERRKLIKRHTIYVMNGTSYVCRRERKQNEQQQIYHSDLLSVPILGAVSLYI